MRRSRLSISPAQVDQARQLRALGRSWDSIGAEFGLHPDTMRRRIDPAYARSERFKYTGPMSFIRAGESRVSPADAARALAGVPVDTRTRQARFMGDPLPGRSALDRLREAVQQ